MRQTFRLPGADRTTAVGLGAVLLFAVLSVLALNSTGSWTSALMDCLRAAGPLALLPLCLAPLRRDRPRWHQGDAGLVALLLATGVLCFVFGRIFVAGSDLLQHQTPAVPSAADVPFLLSYPFLLIALVLLPGRDSSSARTRLLLDMLVLVCAAAAFSWYFVLGPAVLSAHAALPTQVVSAAYPFADVMLVCFLLSLLGGMRGKAPRQVALVLGVALTCLVVGDSAQEYARLHGIAGPGFLDLLRPVAYMLFCLVPVVAQAPLPDVATSPTATWSAPARRRMPRVWRYFLPYCAVPAVVALMIYAARTPGDSRIALGVYVIGGILIELVLVHQLLDYRELIAVANRNARLESLASADPVTGLPNHRAIVSALDGEFGRARRYGHPCAALFLDLDHFKALNDSYGHPAGDAALREFASVVRVALRTTDMLGRWGGEEFVAVLPETDGPDAVAVAERVRESVAVHTFWAAGGAHLTCSIGVAAFPTDATTRDGLIEAADGAMYVAKRLGRNQVRAASDPAVTELTGDVEPAGTRDEAATAGMVEALAALIDARDHDAGSRAHDVAGLAVRLALELGLDTSEAHLVGQAGRIHDIGKVVVPDAVLAKTGTLTAEEWTVVRRHSSVGAAVISRMPRLRALSPVLRAHHERWDGTGYPDGLAGEAIPLGARILAVAEAYCAMTTDRPHQPARTLEEALREIEQCAGTQFDPHLVAALARILGAGVVNSVA